MIKLKVDINKDKYDEYGGIEKYKVKNTNTLEHICAICFLVETIMEYDENININELCKWIKKNHLELIKERESEINE